MKEILSSTVMPQERPPREVHPKYPPVLNIGDPVQLESILRIVIDPKKEKELSMWYIGSLVNNVLSFREKVCVTKRNIDR